MERKVHPWIGGSKLAEQASLMNTAQAVRLFLEWGVVLNELVLEDYVPIWPKVWMLPLDRHRRSSTKASGVTESVQ